MDINETLLRETVGYLYKYDLDQVKIKDFLTNSIPFLERQEKAINIIKKIMTPHGKDELRNQVAELARVEHGIRELESWARDHVVHALLSFLLGIYINEKFLSNQGATVNIFQWKITGLFHDVGYPVQISKDILKQYTSQINKIKKGLGFKIQEIQDIDFRINLGGIENLTNNINSFDLIQEYLYKWDLQINAREEYKKMVDSSKRCHGIISSLTNLYAIDLMYQKNNPRREHKDTYSGGVNWNQTCFDIDVVSACSAIYIHDLPERCFTNAKIDRYESPIAFLLKLSDCLQEWERPSKENEKGIPSNKFDIRIDNNNLIFYAYIPDNDRNKIKDEISSTLKASDIQII